MSDSAKEVLDHQRLLWENTFSTERDFFTDEASEPARKAMELFKKQGKTNILELGGGQGRDTILFANNGFHITVLDYSNEAIKAVAGKAHAAGLPRSVQALRHVCARLCRFPKNLSMPAIPTCYSVWHLRVPS